MLNDYQPILFNTPLEQETAEIYFIHDLHKGSAEHDAKKWDKVKTQILAAPNRYALFIGDMLENAIPGSKSDMFYQTIPPHEQKEWFAEQLYDLADRTVGVVDGNHERRTTKSCGLFPLYDCCVMAGIKDRYRPHFIFADIAVGRRHNNTRGDQVHYVGYCVHKAKDLRAFSTADTIDGIDFFGFGHDHDPREHPRAKLVYDSKRKEVTRKSIETINSGAFLNYGGYAADFGYRPTSDKLYKLILDGTNKKMTTVGFYV